MATVYLRGASPHPGPGESLQGSVQAGSPTAPGGRLSAGGYLYLLAVSLAGLGLVALALASAPLNQSVYSALGGAVLAGALLTLRPRVGQPATTLVLVPTLVAYARFGADALPLLPIASLLAALLQRNRAAAALALSAHDALAFTGAHLLTAAVAQQQPLLGLALFATALSAFRVALWQLARRAGGPALLRRQAPQPQLLLPLLFAPLALLPLAAWMGMGDGALLLALAALLALLFVVREAVNLATARREAEQERRRLAEAAAQQEDLIYLITHEVKNPLTALRAYTDLAKRAVDTQHTERLPRYLDNIAQGERVIEQLVDDLLELGRLERPGALPPASRTDPGALVRAVAAEMQPMAAQRQQQLVIELTAGVPAFVGVESLLRKALSNLISNAIKYTPEGGRITVWTRPGDHPGTVEIGVSDTGIGLSETDQEHLFSRFFRSADPRAASQRGSGLGLALTQAIIHRMGGEITVESQLDRGTTFRLVLPVEPAEE